MSMFTFYVFFFLALAPSSTCGADDAENGLCLTQLRGSEGRVPAAAVEKAKHAFSSQHKADADAGTRDRPAFLDGQGPDSQTDQQTDHESGSTALFASCPLDRFDVALKHLLAPTRLENTSGVGSAREHYEHLAGQLKRSCPKLSTNWFTNSKRLIINLGYGTTGTSWVKCIMNQTLNFSSAHYDEALDQATGTEFWNGFDYISDTPVPDQAWELINSNPQGTFLLSLRDAETWMQKRLHNHPYIHSQVSPCGQHPLISEHDKMASPGATVAYEAWVTCLVPQDQLFAFNLWKMDRPTFVLELVQFLAQRGHLQGQWQNEVYVKTRLPAMLEACSGRKPYKHF
jgi:hypothetical protein